MKCRHIVAETNTDLGNAAGWTAATTLIDTANLGNGIEDARYRANVAFSGEPQCIRLRAVKQ